ncbi:response regulator [Chryseosolibacter indicus]|uniref:Response regulator transcription factor n=1 Tax=Chryseosolibacter indicus TaxID=2782351 RepID=A0ABS5VSD6_9BACT|nr:response regulator transcription factor [Chryseosolibacter indicus]MBT1703943.1 response regulator transcription factor [Chryseosolibacter indicus]
MQSKVKVVIVDDHGLLRQGLVSLLSNSPAVEVLTSVSSGEEAISLSQEMQPDVFLMDIMLQGMSGIEATRWLKEQMPSTKVILVSSEVNKAFVVEGIKAGIDGYLPKHGEKEQLLQAIQVVAAGQRFFSPEVTTLVFEDFYLEKKEGRSGGSKSERLTKREEEILVSIANGKALKQIAEEFFISTKTVETHKLNIQEKLGVANTAQLVKYAIEKKYV